jgi:hypothetical protein
MTVTTKYISRWNSSKDRGPRGFPGAAGGVAVPDAEDILTNLLTVDGTGSGLDADLLDGNHASAFPFMGQNNNLLGSSPQKIYGNSDADNYYIGHYAVTGADGLMISWYGGVNIQCNSDRMVLQEGLTKFYKAGGAPGATTTIYDFQNVGDTSLLSILHNGTVQVPVGPLVVRGTTIQVITGTSSNTGLINFGASDVLLGYESGGFKARIYDGSDYFNAWQMVGTSHYLALCPSEGKVKIGAGAPAEALDVAGNIIATGDIIAAYV